MIILMKSIIHLSFTLLLFVNIMLHLFIVTFTLGNINCAQMNITMFMITSNHMKILELLLLAALSIPKSEANKSSATEFRSERN